ncbi:hypothetical protein Acr_18g0009740 [Actinidia rufa]|uniref:Uncharacterized protein n=1 Tax=Actinidia rufa TaxID=165716 RepID=A0A7J0G7M5_9ERIC|nr:hypothetical protein Acr_18g0009740 [Actinidia rufa]
MSPSPISSPRTTSGSSTPLTGGSANILYHQLNQSVYLQEGFGIKSQNHYTNSPSCHSPYHDIFRGTQSGSQIFRELLSSENETIGKHFGRPLHGELYDGQSVLADRVSQQLLRDHAKLSPSLDLSSCSPFPDRMSGISLEADEAEDEIFAASYDAWADHFLWYGRKVDLSREVRFK